MNKAIKWGMVIVGLLAALVIGAVILLPMFIDVKQYKPWAESLATEYTGRPVSIGDDIDLSVFPWVGVKLTDVAVGNPKGFKTGNMVSVKTFEVRLKVMPLLSRKIEVDSFILDSPQIALEKNKAGKGNWENIGPAGSQASGVKSVEKTGGPSAQQAQGLPVASLSVGRCAIVNGSLSYADTGTGVSKSVSDLNLEITDISLDSPVKLSFKALVDGQPVGLSGNVGPLGQNPGKENMGLDLNLAALDTLKVGVKGTLILAEKTPGLDAAVSVESFSPRTLFEKLGQPFPVKTLDPKVLDKVSLSARVKGSALAVALSEGKMVLDDSTLAFSAGVKEFSKPDISFDLSLDKIDADRYLPPPAKTESLAAAQSADGNPQGETAPSKAVDYSPLRKLVLDGKAAIGELKVANLAMAKITAKVTGKNGVFNLDPFSVDLYEGSALAKAKLDVRGNAPKSEISLDTKGIQAGPLVKDGAGKDIIEGTLAADVNLTMTGDSPELIRKTLGGSGGMTFTDGAIVGVDIAGIIRKTGAGLGLTESATEKPKTDFAELKIPFTASQGLVSVPGASLVSPLLRLAASGKTNLVSEVLDFRVEPKLVATIKGQGDTKDRSGLLIPLLVTGTWQAPKIRPDLEGMIKQKMADPDALKSLIQGDKNSGSKQSVEEKAKGLLKGLFN